MTYTPILNNPTEWNGKNKICSECPEELNMNDYEEICINCFNQVEPEEEEEKVKTYECIEYGKIFYIEAKNMEEAIEFASIYGGSIIKEINLKYTQ